ncbi:PepSY domain-containing protein [Roseococcus sp. SDR]|uniref:PepSY domain-containing protein n=1 Tax=Roseococcus sp. SDR TaxID=2835532 RepID=UPI001BCE9CF1|nr:PepSY domain-containing protein [Roseococcus sp. SDR]MBS7790980.1 PepSY domain-containing protein [Roseococcus sp. SDR]MBV1846294.1 PepSY domain-containing protein [Roseococcus sp. SDR]
MRKTLLLAALATSIAAGPLAAQPAATTTRFADIAARLEGQGFQIQEMERKNDRFEVKAMNAQGQRLRLDVDATTGAILRQDARTRDGHR